MNKIIKCNDLNITTYIEDTDFQGFVYHANYLKFFERARSDFLAQNKISQKALRKNNLAFVVKKVNMNFISAAELGYDLIVKSSVEKKSNARMIFSQKIMLTLFQKIVTTFSRSIFAVVVERSCVMQLAKCPW